MAKAIDVANFIIDMSSETSSPQPMTMERLQCLLFLTQGWHLARHGTPLFPEAIEAWQDGYCDSGQSIPK
ncbi:hypothetical protein FACS1894184_08460 [Clostridia bacterium]|nr:hypothetical protein FACS1894184_08460 [Clostridia bacterium]